MFEAIKEERGKLVSVVNKREEILGTIIQENEFRKYRNLGQWKWKKNKRISGKII